MIVVDQLDSVVHALEGATGLAEDKMRMFVCFFLQVIVGLFMNFFVTRSSTIRSLYCMSMGVFLTTYMFRETAYHIITMSMGAYLIMTSFPR
jgi:hypothetical protein